MGGKDFHRTAFDRGTKVKLRLFENYLREWLPVFINRPPSSTRINIVDFFAGPGRDVSGELGSPLIALREIRKSGARIRGLGKRVRLLLNEKAKRKAANLRKILEAQQIPEDLCTWEVSSLGFHEALQRYHGTLRGCANLLFFDQGGMKFIDDDVFSRILNLKMTDIMFFIASSSLRRFAEHPYFSKHLPIPKGKISARRFSDTHRVVTEHYRSLIPADTEFYLGTYSIKKGSNLYGIIFGSGHPLGIEKFLRVCWKEDPTTGEANFDIDANNIDRHSPHLFPEMDRPKKLRVFEQDLRNRILRKEFSTDRDVYLFVLQEGCLPLHGRRVLTKMIKERLVRMKIGGPRPRVSRDGYREPREFELV